MYLHPLLIKTKKKRIMKIGSKVVCLKNYPVTNPFFGLISGTIPKKGDVLTIRNVVKDPATGCPILLFENILSNTNPYNGLEMGWGAEYFAPIEPKQELSEHTTETLIEELEEQLQPC